MYSKLRNFIYAFFLIVFLMIVFPIKISACTYEATIVGNHLNLSITSDKNYIQLVQLMHVNDLTNAPYKITALQGPVGYPWMQYLDFSQTYSGYSMVIQNRRQIADGAYWVSWIDSTHYLHIPSGIYGVDFTGTMNYSDISVEYGTMDDNGNVDAIGEHWTFCTRTGDIGTSNPTPSPIPTLPSTPTPTPFIPPVPTPIIPPIPSPTPSPASSVSKVFFIPGLGASWNADALLNCKPDSNPNDWTLAPYASDIYTPLMTALTESGWNTIPYYYDWRKQIPDNIQGLSDLISNNQKVNEKVNVVGHSMGGLIGREYLESWWGKNLNSLLTIGSPHRGSALAYPAWAGGDVWNDNFIEKMAITLYLKHCGKVFPNDRVTLNQNIPSIQNLLPIDPYLQKVKSNTLYLPYTNTNNWLRPFVNYWGIKVETISGNGFNTLETIQTKDPSRKEVKDGNWIDGKPAGKIYTTQGDGTVTSECAKLPGYPNISINETHSGLVNSIDGMSSVLSFLGSPQNLTLQSSQTEINSALVIVGYPSNFTVTSGDGLSKKDKDGMVSFMNPKNGQYKINLLPKSNNTLFIVAQFLKNGDVKYKEYNFQGLGPKLKTLKFDSVNPTDDILVN